MQGWTQSEFEEYIRDNPLPDVEVDPAELEELLVEESDPEIGMEGQGDLGQGPSNPDPTQQRPEENRPPQIPGLELSVLDASHQEQHAEPSTREQGEIVSGTQDPPHHQQDPPQHPEGEINPIWEGASDGTENVARRTPIVVTPGVAHYTTREVSDPQRVANWQDRGLQEMEFTPPQLNRMRQLKVCTMEFAAISGNKYIPPGFDVDDLLRLYTADRPEVLTEHDLHLRTMAAEILQLKGQMKMKEQTFAGMFARLDAMEDTLKENQEVMANWEIEEEAYAEQHPTEETGQDPAYQQDQPAVASQPTVAAQPSLPLLRTPVEAMAIDGPDYQQRTGWPPVTAAPTVPVPPASTVPAAAAAPAAHVSQLNFMKKLTPFAGNRSLSGTATEKLERVESRIHRKCNYDTAGAGVILCYDPFTTKPANEGCLASILSHTPRREQLGSSGQVHGHTLPCNRQIC